ncbi:hypothetical protein V3W47_16570 [Deinococcus sp. YIM 134068]|uniref:hypothetical protein n=1 Tax=Deinococcus lichenicola TaxID=3118910 RepID=UPI002F94DDDD
MDATVVDAHGRLDDLISEFNTLRAAAGLSTDRIDDVLVFSETLKLLNQVLLLRGGESGELEKLQEHVQQALRHPPPGPELVAVVRALLVTLRLADGDPREARRALRDHYDLAMEAAAGELRLETGEKPAAVADPPEPVPVEVGSRLTPEESSRADIPDEEASTPTLTAPADVRLPRPSQAANMMAWQLKRYASGRRTIVGRVPVQTLAEQDNSPHTGAQDSVAVLGIEEVEVEQVPMEDSVTPATPPEEGFPTVQVQELHAPPEPTSAPAVLVGPNQPDGSSGMHDGRLWGLTARGEVALAYHIATALGCPEEERELLRALVYADGMAGPLDEATEAFEVAATGMQLVTAHPASRALQVAAALLPALVGASNTAVTVLREAQADAQTPILARDVAQAFVRVNDALNTADVLSALTALPEARDTARRAERKRDLNTRINETRRDWPKRTVAYQGASQVWRALWYPDALLGQAFAQAVETQARVEADWSDADLDRLIDEVQVAHDPKADRIHSKARDKLTWYLHEARALLQEWNAVCGRASDDYRAVKLGTFLDEWRDLAQRVEQRTPEEDVTLEAALSTLVRQFRQADGAVNGHPRVAVHPNELLRRGLLRMGLMPQDDGMAREKDVALGLYEERAEAALHEVRSWDAVLDGYVQTGDFRSAYAVLEMLDEDERAASRGMLDREVDEVSRGLRRAVAQGRADLERALYQGLLPEEIARDLEARLTELGQRLDDPRGLRTASVHAELRDTQETCARYAGNLTLILRTRLEGLQTDPGVVALVERQLERGDFHTAQEYLGLLERGETLPEEPGPALLTLLPAALGQADKLYAQGSRKMVQDATLGALRFLPHQHALSAERQKSSVRLLEKWFDLFSPVTPAKVKSLLEGLDFTVRQVEADKRLERLFVLRGPEIRDRRIIPAALFGSQASGQYRVYVTPHTNIGVRQVFNQLTNIREPVIVAYNGRLSLEERREAARLCRESARTVVFVDTLVMLLLAAEPDDRRPGLFRYTLPFTWFVPFTSVATFIPPEMFYGREQALDALLDPRGANYVFGGRQLGKSALLMQAVERGHAPERDTIVCRIDINSIGLGGRAAKDIWAMMTAELAQYGLVDPQTLTAGTFVRSVRGWLGAKVTRRVVLLLDEADGFLRQDAGEDGSGPYTEIKELKALMDGTQRRFKVVLTGLNNVVRTYAKNNSPLVHLGDPIEIGPMVEGAERQAASQLLTEPFELLGYTFERVDLAYRILARTNYYPSLIQLYADALLRDLQRRGENVPTVIRDADVDAVYHSRVLRDRIRERFLWTLGLDPRYEVIAYALAFELDEENVTLSGGASLDQLYDWATSWLPRAFEGQVPTTREQFKPLLDEMVTLGVLRTVGRAGDYYTFRNANAKLLLGAGEQIHHKLVSLQPRMEREARLGPASRRESLPRKPHLAAPLDVRQLSETVGYQHGVSVVTASVALGAARLPDFLRHLLGQKAVIDSQAHDLNTFKTELEDLRRVGDGALRLLFVPFTLPWDERWLEEADGRLGGLTRQRDVRRVVFIADPAQWSRTRESGVLRQDGLSVVHARPWTPYEVCAWLEQHLQVSRDDLLDRISTRTGNWPFHLDRAFRNLLNGQDDEVAVPQLAERATANARLGELGLRPIDRRVLSAFVSGGATSDDHETVAILAEELGLPPQTVRSVLETGEVYAWVRRDAVGLQVPPVLAELLTLVPT